MKFILIIICLIGFYSHRVTSTIRCSTGNGVSGTCVHAHKCKPVNDLRSIPHQLHTLQDYMLLTHSNCIDKYDQPTDKVCCPHHHKPTLINVSPTTCLIHENKIGTCMNIQLCPSLSNILTAPATENVLSYVETLRCGDMKRYSVCCDSEQLLHPADTQHQAGVLLGSVEDVYDLRVECTMSAQPPEPQSECCGIHGDEERIVGGSVTGIDEYPWLALIEYIMKLTNSIEPGCGGSLISGRYVLTASHCLTGDFLIDATPVNVRLGEYDLSNPGPDCIDTAGGGEDCTNGPLIIPIEEIVLHSQYDPNDDNRYHDIALIRLSKMAPYSDFIRPICLPSFDLALFAPEDLTLYASGWGMTDNQQKISNIKRAVDLPYRPLSECEAVYNEINVTLWRGQICAGGEKGKDSCKGDSGGPLMYKNYRTPYTVAAIINYGAKPCGQKDVPSVYTNVYVYLQWIYDHIKP